MEGPRGSKDSLHLSRPHVGSNVSRWCQRDIIRGPVKNATADGTDGVDSLMEGDEGTKRKAHVLSE